MYRISASSRAEESTNLLITAGNTRTPIDRVRCLTNIFTGRTGARIAVEARARGHAVTLLTSHPDTVAAEPGLVVTPYSTFDDLHGLMAEAVPTGKFDAIIHSAAVSDYALAGVFSTQTSPPNPLSETERGNKIGGSHPELWLKLTPTPKLVDFVRGLWQFPGILVKFKLEVDVTTAELLAITKRSRAQSDADFLVANTLDSYETDAWLIDRADSASRIDRAALPAALLDRIEHFFRRHPLGIE